MKKNLLLSLTCCLMSSVFLCSCQNVAASANPNISDSDSVVVEAEKSVPTPWVEIPYNKYTEEQFEFLNIKNNLLDVTVKNEYADKAFVCDNFNMKNLSSVTRVKETDRPTLRLTYNDSSSKADLFESLKQLEANEYVESVSPVFNETDNYEQNLIDRTKPPFVIDTKKDFTDDEINKLNIYEREYIQMTKPSFVIDTEKDFADDKIFVMLTGEESQKRLLRNNVYFDDTLFSDAELANPPLILRDDHANKYDFLQIYLLTLKNPGRENVINAIEALKQNKNILRACPKYEYYNDYSEYDPMNEKVSRHYDIKRFYEGNISKDINGEYSASLNSLYVEITKKCSEANPNISVDFFGSDLFSNVKEQEPLFPEDPIQVRKFKLYLKESGSDKVLSAIKELEKNDGVLAAYPITMVYLDLCVE